MLTARRVDTAGVVNASHTEASKAEEDFKHLQERKKAQDLYLDKLSKDMEVCLIKSAVCLLQSAVWLHYLADVYIIQLQIPI